MKQSNRKNYRKKNKRTRRRKQKGVSPSIFYGGYGGVSYQGTPALDGVSAYSYNNKMADPTTPSFIENARNLPNMTSTGGGRRRMRGKSMRFRRKMKGGDPFSNTNSLDGPTNTQGAFQGANIIAGNNIPNTAPYSQPIQQMYNKYNSPLV